MTATVVLAPVLDLRAAEPLKGELLAARGQALTLDGYTPERVAHEFAVMEEAMMVRRNRAWIPVLTAAAKEGPVLAAFGALHLSGPEGVLALLKADGFKLERLAFR